MKTEKYKKTEGFTVICSYCNKVLQGQELWDREGKRQQGVNDYRLSHGICPKCLLDNFPNEYLAIQEEKRIRIKKVFQLGFQNMYGHLTS